MPYGIGQYRKGNITQYFEDSAFTMNTIIKENAAFGNINFEDQIAEVSVDNQSCYYLHFSVEQMTTLQTFYLKLINRDDSNTREQFIEQYQIAGVEGNNKKIYFETILSPNAVYDTILWELQRTASDITNNNQGREMNVTINSFIRLTDILPTIRNSQNNNSIPHFTKIGVQGPPSLLMCINREPIRIGRNGIYELNNGININSISFAPRYIPSSDLNSNSGSLKLDYFIMDYEY